jgi:hypothetical protein
MERDRAPFFWHARAQIARAAAKPLPVTRFAHAKKKNPAIRIAGFKVCINQEEEVDTEGDITTDNIGTGGSFSSSLAEAPYLPGELRR